MNFHKPNPIISRLSATAASITKLIRGINATCVVGWLGIVMASIGIGWWLHPGLGLAIAGAMCFADAQRAEPTDSTT